MIYNFGRLHLQSQIYSRATRDRSQPSLCMHACGPASVKSIALPGRMSTHKNSWRKASGNYGGQYSYMDFNKCKCSIICMSSSCLSADYLPGTLHKLLYAAALVVHFNRSLSASRTCRSARVHASSTPNCSLMETSPILSFTILQISICRLRHQLTSNRTHRYLRMREIGR